MKKNAMRALPWGREYKNNGQHAQQVVAYNLLGIHQKADNKPFYAGGDVGTMQVKSARATICKGTDIRAHVAEDGATCYGYLTYGGDLYIMTPAEYIEFVEEFAYVSRDSESRRGRGGSNGGGVKLVLRTCAEGPEMYKWFKDRM